MAGFLDSIFFFFLDSPLLPMQINANLDGGETRIPYPCLPATDIPEKCLAPQAYRILIHPKTPSNMV
jgi:hypothetical protein